MNLRDYINSLHFEDVYNTASIHTSIKDYIFVFDAKIGYFHNEIRLCFSLYLKNTELNMSKQIAVGCLSKKKLECRMLLAEAEKYSNARLSVIMDNVLTKLEEYSIFLRRNVKCVDASERVKQEVDAFFNTIGYDYKNTVYNSFYNTVLEYQEHLLYNNLERKHEKECKFLDDLTKELPKPTESFYNWLNYEYMPEYRYFFYKYSKTQFVEGICSVCGNKIELLRKTNNSFGVCPHCGKPVIYRSKNRKNSIRANDWVIYPTIVKGVTYIQIYDVTKVFSEYKQKVILIPTFLCILKDNHTYFLIRKYFYKYNCTRWGFSKGSLCDIEYILKTSEKNRIYNLYSFSRILSFKQCGDLRNSIRTNEYSGSVLYTAIMLYSSWVLETLYKIGNKALMLSESLNFMQNYSFKPNTSKRKLHRELGIRKSYLKLLPTASGRDLILMQNLTKSNILLPVAELEELLPYNLTTRTLNLINGIGISRIKKYIKLQVQMNGRDDYDLVVAMYKEYMNKISFNTFATVKDKLLSIFPNNLQLAYNSIKFSNRHNVDENKVYTAIQKYKEQYAFEYGNYIIKAPHDLYDLDREGTILEHCLSTYAEKVQNGLTVILFLREKNKIEVPFYTLECIGDKILQCRGYQNKKPTMEVEQFLLHYKRHLEKGGIYNGIYS